MAVHQLMNVNPPTYFQERTMDKNVNSIARKRFHEMSLKFQNQS